MKVRTMEHKITPSVPAETDATHLPLRTVTEDGPHAISTRVRLWRDICERHPDPRERLSVWATTNVIRAIPEDEWGTMHAGTCALCGGEPARLFPTGWRCSSCDPAGVS